MKKIFATLLAFILCGTAQAATAKAIWSANNKTLYFVYDNTTYTAGGSSYDGQTVTQVWEGAVYTTGTPHNEKGPAWRDIVKNDLERVVFTPTIKDVRFIELAWWFVGCTKLKCVEGMKNLKQVGSMSKTFSGCSSLSDLDLTGFDTSEVLHMNYTFEGCSSLQNLNLSGFITSKCQTFAWMFYGCKNLSDSFDLQHFKTENVNNMEAMFAGCSNLTSLNLAGWNTEKVTNMHSMFQGCGKLTTLNISGFKTPMCTRMDNMFQGCSNVTELDLSGFDTEKVTSFNMMFLSCGSLTGILDLSHFKTPKVTNMFGMFAGCGKLTELNLSGWDNTVCTTMQQMFEGCGALTTLNLKGFKTPKVTNMIKVFSSVSKVTSLDLNSFDTSAVTDMYGMFVNCQSLIQLGIRHFNTEKVIRMQQMFQNCKALEELDLSEWKNTATTNMTNMFRDCEKLERIDLTDFNTSAVTEMQYMFCGCKGLEELDLRSFDTYNVKNMAYMFQGCTGLYYLDLSHFKTSSLGSSYQYMFEGIPKVFVYMAPGRTDQITEGIKNTKTPNRQNIIIGSPGNFTCDNCVFTDEARDLRLPYAFKAKKITYNRTLPGDRNGYTALLPYSMEIPDGLRAYQLRADKKQVGKKDNIIYFEQIDGPLQANTPYLISNWSGGDRTDLLNVAGTGYTTEVINTITYRTQDGTQILTAYDGANNVSTTLDEGKGEAVSMTGTFKVVTKGDALADSQWRYYIMQAGNKWKTITSASGGDDSKAYIYPFRAFLLKSGDSNVSQFSSLLAEDDETGVTEIGTETEIETIDHDGTRTRYDLSGRRLSRPTRGIHIVGGRKTVVY